MERRPMPKPQPYCPACLDKWASQKTAYGSSWGIAGMHATCRAELTARAG